MLGSTEISRAHDTEPLRMRGGRAPAASSPREGDDLGSWRLDHLIAGGGCGTVWRAHHRVLARSAAVKVLHHELARSEEMVARFVQEARAVNLIRHPNIIDVVDFGELPDGRPYFVMELLAPENLEDRVAGAGRLTVAETAAVVTSLAAALAAAHRHGFVHRDVKPRNVGFAVSAAGGEVVKLLDFGVAKLLAPERDGAGASTQRVGTPQCMSPEQIRGDAVGPWTDVYGLGVTIFHLLAGRDPFHAADPIELERMHLEDTAPSLATLVAVPPGLDAVVAAALAKAPSRRPGLEILVETMGAAW